MKIFRAIIPSIKKSLFKEGKKKVCIIYGPRQAGKTTLVKYLLKEYPEKAEYFNCDYLDVRETFSSENINRLAHITKGLKLLVLDEAQRIENIGVTLKILVDEHPHVQIIATGSSSFDLSNKIKEPLTGRKIEFYLFPFSFNELFANKNSLEQIRCIEHFLRFGSYPEISQLNEMEAKQSLQELTGSYLFKDIFTFQQLRKPEMLIKLLRLLAFQVGSQVSFHELATQLGVDQSIVQKYIHLLEEALIIFRLGAFKRNLRSEISKSRKIYFWDLGIRNAIIENFNSLELRNDVGVLWENFCVAERIKYLRNNQLYANTYFWRTYSQKEIDYLEEKEGKLLAMEFKWNDRKKSRTLKDFFTAYPETHLTTITPNNVSSLFQEDFH
ncbi:MAG: ATP-binding protein [Nitrospinae bacterium]|nr:ATP-binding protein [Nitrospinota bacterium]